VSDREPFPVETLKLSGILVEPGMNPRAELSEAAVEDYAALYAAGHKLDRHGKPVVFRQERGGRVTDRLASGFHRYAAARRAGLGELECEVRPGGRHEALVFALQQNTDFGVRRTRADLARAVEIALADPRLAKLSNRELAQLLDCDESAVRRRRNAAKDADAGDASERSGDEESAAEPQHAPRPSPPLDGRAVAADREGELTTRLNSEAAGGPRAAEPQSPPFPEGADDAEATFSLVEHRGAEEEEARPVAGGRPPAPLLPASTPPPTVQKPATRVEDMPRDQMGRVLPGHLVPVFGTRNRLREASADVGRVLKNLRSFDRDDEIGGFLLRRPYLLTDLERAADFLRTRLAPYCVCPACGGDGDAGQCPTCDGAGWLTRAGYAALPDVLRLQAASFKPHDAWEPDESNLPPPRPDDVRGRAAGGRDALGEVVPKHLKDVFAADFLHECLSDLKRWAGVLNDAKGWLPWLKPETHPAVEQVIRYVEDAIPFAVCVHCGGDPKRSKACAHCHTAGYHPRWSQEAGNNTPPAKGGKKAGGGK
jgi:ParB-like chromosome segregation protein Spo0J